MTRTLPVRRCHLCDAEEHAPHWRSPANPVSILECVDGTLWCQWCASDDAGPDTRAGCLRVGPEVH